MISAIIEIAISFGFEAFIGNPTGPFTLLISSSEKPKLTSLSILFLCVFLLPKAPM